MEMRASTQAFIDCLAARKFEELAQTLTPDAVARFLLPRGPQETAGANAIASRFEGWFGGADRFTVLQSANERFGRRWLLHWRFRLCRDGQSNEIIEQVAFADAGPEGISRLDLVCSGFLSDSAAQPDTG